MLKIPLQINIVYHPNFELGEEYGKIIFKLLDKNPDEISQNDIGIPVKLHKNFINFDSKFAEKTLVIVFIDQCFILDKNFEKKLEKIEETEIEWLFIIIDIPIDILPNNIRAMNVMNLTDREIHSRFDPIISLETNELKKEYLTQNILERTVNLIYSETEKKKAKLFLSHTKRDEFGRNLALDLKYMIQILTKSEVFFDENSIELGTDIWNEIESVIKKKETFVIAINTDEYSNSAWCRREILSSKMYKRPLLVIDAIRNKQNRSFPYLGNTRVIKYNENFDKNYQLYNILKELYLKAIKFKIKEKKLLPYKDKGEISIATPELIDLAINQSSMEKIYYSDPPLPQEEIELFKIFKKTLVTPLQEMILQNEIKNKKIMLSISENEDIVDLSIKSLLSDMIKYFIAFDFQILYGGNLKYENKEMNLVIQILKTLDFYKKIDVISSDKRVINYVAYPLNITSEDRIKTMKEIDYIFINPDNLPLEEAQTNFSNNKIWEKSLSAMREKIVEDSDYLIIAGGKTRGFKGKMPGILEEFLNGLKNKKSIFLLGAFNGVTKEIINYIQGEEISEEMKKFERYLEEIPKNISLNNGLTEEENKILFELENSSQIIELILKGIRNLEVR